MCTSSKFLLFNDLILPLDTLFLICVPHGHTQCLVIYKTIPVLWKSITSTKMGISSSLFMVDEIVAMNLWSFVDSTLRPASTESLAILLHTAPAINTDGRHYLSFNIIINQECCHLLRMILMHHILTTKWMQTEVASTVMPLLFGMSLVTEEVSSWWSYRCPLANCQHTLKSFKKWSESTITINPLILL